MTKPWYFAAEDDIIGQIYEFCSENAASKTNDLNLSHVPDHDACVKIQQQIREVPTI